MVIMKIKKVGKNLHFFNKHFLENENQTSCLYRLADEFFGTGNNDAVFEWNYSKPMKIPDYTHNAMLNDTLSFTWNWCKSALECKIISRR